MKLKSIFTFLLCIAVTCGYAQDTKFSFNSEGKFKIAQFTDLHWSNTSPGCAETTATIKSVLKTEKPDLAVLTGDVVTDPPAEPAWKAIAEIFHEMKTPFAVVLGNHDGEAGISQKRIFEILADSPFFVGEVGPENIHGTGNYIIPVQGKSGKTSALLYFFDSNDYPPVTKYGHYDWIHFDQITWYREQSARFTKDNNNAPLPALAFFHIPFLEYNNVVGKNTTIGTMEEGVASPRINSGLFSSMIDMGDVMGTFVGHDHDNDYIGIEYDIALAFGRTTGTDAYGILERGGRIIELYEDKFKFDTWIRTPKGAEWLYYFPSGLSSVDEEGMEYLPALNVKPTKQGVSYTYYEGKFKTTAQMLEGKQAGKGTLKNFSIEEAPLEDGFGYDFRTYIHIPEKGVYKFYTYSDDGSRLLINGQTVVDNDGSHSSRKATGKVALEAGFHELRVLYFEDYMGQVLEVGFSSRDIRESTIPDNILYLPE